MFSMDKVYHIALIDDESPWLERVSEQIVNQCGENFIVHKFIDWKDFYKEQKMSDYDVIISDYMFLGYNIEQTDPEALIRRHNFDGLFFLMTTTPELVQKPQVFKAVLDKAEILRRKRIFLKDYVRVVDGLE